MKKHYDAIIIGGGASGMMCAIAAKQKNKNLRIAILEKNDRIGKKLLSTGNGRCNLTNENICVEKYVGSFSNQCDAVIKKCNTKELLSRFEALGLLCTFDSEGRYYPLCKQASAVLDVLRFALDRLGISVFCSTDIRSLKKTNDTFIIRSESDEFSADKLVIASGSKAAPKLGGSAGGADYLKNLGHHFQPFSPALCPITVQSAVLKSLKGIRANGSVRLIRNGKTIKTEQGEIQFAENSLSGICIFNLSPFVKNQDEIAVDLLPNLSNKELSLILKKNIRLFSSMEVDTLFTGILQKRIAQAILKMSHIKEFSRTCQTLSDNELKNIVQTAKEMSFTVTGKAGFDRAQAATGGVVGSEIDENTMQSKVCENLFVCGEVIDLCGECGGYNLHFAFASGIIAGENL